MVSGNPATVMMCKREYCTALQNSTVSSHCTDDFDPRRSRPNAGDLWVVFSQNTVFLST